MKANHVQTIVCVVLLFSFFLVIPHSAAQSQDPAPSGPTYIIFDVPNALSLTVTGLNNAGAIVGQFQDSQTNTTRGFVRGSDGTITVFDAVANTWETVPAAINDAGDVAGSYADSSTQSVLSFLRDAGGAITTFGVPQAFQVLRPSIIAMVIDNGGAIAGFILPDIGGDTRFGFVRDGQGNITTFPPLSPGQPTPRIFVTCINERGDLAGLTGLLNRDGFVRDREDGVITVFDVGNAGTNRANPAGINNRGDVAGSYLVLQGGQFQTRGFVRTNDGNVTTFDSPLPSAINDSGEIVGEGCSDATGSHLCLRDPNGTLTLFDVPNASVDEAVASVINNRGDVAGYFIDATTLNTRGFLRIANPSN